MTALCNLCCLGVAVLVCTCWPWGVSGLSMAMLGSVVTSMFIGRFVSLLVAFHLVLSVGELLVASID